LVRRWLLKKKTPEITFKNFPKPTESNNDWIWCFEERESEN
jgi:hypothetical protein